MKNPSTTTPGGTWRLLVFDADPGDPKWIIATVVSGADVRPANPGEADPDGETRAWVLAQGGGSVLTPLPRALAWRVNGS